MTEVDESHTTIRDDGMKADGLESISSNAIGTVGTVVPRLQDGGCI